MAARVSVTTRSCSSSRAATSVSVLHVTKLAFHFMLRSKVAFFCFKSPSDYKRNVVLIMI